MRHRGICRAMGAELPAFVAALERCSTDVPACRRAAYDAACGAGPESRVGMAMFSNTQAAGSSFRPLGKAIEPVPRMACLPCRELFSPSP